MSQLAPGGHPACIGDTTSVGTSDLDPRLLLETQLLLQNMLASTVVWLHTILIQ